MSRAYPDFRKRRQLQPLKKAKVDTIYSVVDVAKLYGVAQNTVLNWTKKGLPLIRDGNRYLFRGDRLNQFHRERLRDARRPCSGAELYCVRCKSPQTPLQMQVRPTESHFPRRKTIEWTCNSCGGRNATALGSHALARLGIANVKVVPSSEEGDS